MKAPLSGRCFCRRLHSGHCVCLPVVRCATLVSHTWPDAHCHQTFWPLANLTSVGRNGRLSVGCHSAATSGRNDASDLPGSGFRCASPTRRYAHGGHPPQGGDVRFLTSASHSWPQSLQTQRTRACEPGRVVSGVSSGLVVHSFHSRARSGNRCASVCPSVGGFSHR